MFNWYQIIMISHYLNLPSPILLMSSMWFIILQNKMHRIQQLECPRSLLIRLVFIRLNKDGHSFYVQFTNRVTLDDVTNRNIFRVALLALCAVHRSPLNSPHNGQWRGALMFSLICAWINGWVNNREAGDLRRHRAHYDVSALDWFYRLYSTTLVPYSIMRNNAPISASVF